MRNFLTTAMILAATVVSVHAQTAPVIKRTPLATDAMSPSKNVTRVEVVRLDFLPGMVTPLHLHPVPVITYVEKGRFLFQIEGQPAHHYKAGDAVYEPANARILHYDNESKTEPAVLIASYLAGADDHALITLLSK